MSNRRKIDLDAAQRARKELIPDTPPPVVVIGEKEFELPAKLPGRVPVLLAYVRKGRLEFLADALVELFGDKADEVVARGFEAGDVDAVLEGAYGDETGEEDELPESSGSAT